MDAAKAVRPGLNAGYVVDADAQNLGIQFLKRRPDGPLRRNLVTSDRRPGLRVECQYNSLIAQVGKVNILFQVAGELKIRRLVGNF